MNNYIFLDLEATIIDNWSTFNIIENNVAFINKIIRSTKTTNIGIFSYAIWGDHNLEIFKREKLEYLNKFLNEPIKEELIITVPQMIEYSRRINSKIVGTTLYDYWKFFHKENAFVDFTKVFCLETKPTPTSISLIDDTISKGYDFHLYIDKTRVDFYSV